MSVSPANWLQVFNCEMRMAIIHLISSAYYTRFSRDNYDITGDGLAFAASVNTLYSWESQMLCMLFVLSQSCSVWSLRCPGRVCDNGAVYKICLTDKCADDSSQGQRLEY
jgi:hypothetical protein